MTTPADFRQWRKDLGFSQEEAAEALGVSKGSVVLYEAGHRRDRARTPVEIPKTVALAMRAVFHKLEPWGA